MAAHIFRRFSSSAKDLRLGIINNVKIENVGGKFYSTAAEPAQSAVEAARTSIDNPASHTSDQIGLWYTLQPESVKHLFSYGGLPKTYVTNCKTFAETCLMVRQPAISCIDYIKRSDLTLPPNKFLLYGPEGVGKSLSLASIIKFLSDDGWLIVHLPWAVNWRRNFKEIVPSASVPGQYDHPVDATLWLQHFRNQNQTILKDEQLLTSESYVWSRRETTEAGSPLSSLVELGMARARFASDCIMALTSELKQLAINDRVKVAVVIDGINTLFVKESRFRREDRTYVEPQNFTIYKAFTSLLHSDWKNGVILGSLDYTANGPTRRDSHLPRYILGDKGWELLDPFVPIPVSNYDEIEMRSAVDYYLDRKWLQNPAAATDVGRKELAMLSGCNPYSFMTVARSI
ncbi:unnamed protein product [Meganyctiphanes norvegica]|uniref:Small ribosomal subunit protein mS29 n=1 Tax=Meganyctiphanes norvegica TaxID=48144 RepID=A0AAV2QHI1_MEGNR